MTAKRTVRLMPDLSIGLALPTFRCGHFRTDANTLINRYGVRETKRCRICHNASSKAHYSAGFQMYWNAIYRAIVSEYFSSAQQAIIARATHWQILD